MASCYLFCGWMFVVGLQDLSRLQGTWVPESIHCGGTDGTATALKLPGYPTRCTISRDEVTMAFAIGKDVKATIKLNPLVSPKQIDVIFGERARLKGIYAIDGDVLLVCIDYSSK